jgi:serine/threonine-protein kinase
MFLDEARLAARIRHPNVVPVLDVVALDGELFLVMDYVQGEALSRLRKGFGMPIVVGIAARIGVDMLNGLHAAHEARNERGEPLEIVHRDVSPHNILVGVDGISRVTDFGIAKAANRIQTTREGQLKGKLAYMAPEQLRERPVDRRTDVYAASVVLWEALTGKRLFARDDPGATVTRILEGRVVPPSSQAPEVPEIVDDIVMKGLARDPDYRFASAQEMALAIEQAVRLEPSMRVGAWVEQVAAASLSKRAAAVSELETGSDSLESADAARLFARNRVQSIPDTEPIGPSRPSVASSSQSEAQLSSVSVERSMAPPRPRTSTPLVALAVALAGVVGFLLIGAVIWRAAAQQHTAAAPASIQVVPAAATETKVEPLVAPQVEVVVPEALPSASAAPEASAAKAKPKPAVVYHPPVKKPPPAKKPGDFSSLTRQ